MSVPHVNTKIQKQKKYIRLEVIKVNQTKEKDQKFQGDECEYKSSKKDAQEPYRRDWYKIILKKNRRNVTDTSMYVPKRVLWYRT